MAGLSWKVIFHFNACLKLEKGFWIKRTIYYFWIKRVAINSSIVVYLLLIFMITIMMTNFVQWRRCVNISLPSANSCCILKSDYQLISVFSFIDLIIFISIWTISTCNVYSKADGIVIFAVVFFLRLPSKIVLVCHLPLQVCRYVNRYNFESPIRLLPLTKVRFFIIATPECGFEFKTNK